MESGGRLYGNGRSWWTWRWLSVRTTNRSHRDQDHRQGRKADKHFRVPEGHLYYDTLSGTSTPDGLISDLKVPVIQFGAGNQEPTHLRLAERKSSLGFARACRQDREGDFDVLVRGSNVWSTTVTRLSLESERANDAARSSRVYTADFGPWSDFALEPASVILGGSGSVGVDECNDQSVCPCVSGVSGKDVVAAEVPLAPSQILYSRLKEGMDLSR